jgi:hypothetical protein
MEAFFMIWTTDSEILAAVKTMSAQFGMSPSAFIMLGRDIARRNKYAIIPLCGPYPRTIDKAEITQDTLYSWPEWVGALAPAGSKWERLHWPDGSFTVRLVNRDAAVLAAVHLPAQTTEGET